MTIPCNKHVGWFIDQSETERFARVSHHIRVALLEFHAQLKLRDYDVGQLRADLKQSLDWLDSHKAITVYIPQTNTVDVEVAEKATGGAE